jgi:hypothetical protein
LYPAITSLGTAFLPGLLVHAHLKYFGLISSKPVPSVFVAFAWVFYADPLIDAGIRGFMLRGLLAPNFLLVLAWFGAAGADSIIFAALKTAALY